MKNSKLILSAAVAVSAILGIGSASAADLAARTYTKAPAPVAVMAYNWTGCYLGGNIGGGWAKTQQSRIGLVNGTVFPAQDYGSGTGSNFIGGVQVGCDYQFAGNWVIGAQGMFDFGNVNSSHIIPPFPTYSSADRTKGMYTATARLGYLFTPELLAYVKGGGAWTGTDSNVTIPATAFLSESSLGNTRSGWTVGGGLEWMFAPGWSVFGEYNYMNFGTKNVAYIPGPLAAPGTVGDLISTKLTAQTLLFGVNYKFNFGGPVVAKY
jgi:outer membrane immunogenic protein